VSESSHSATIKLGLDHGGFRSALSSASSDVANFAKNGAGAVKTIAQHLNNPDGKGLGIAQHMGRSIKQDLGGLMSLTGLGGTFALGALAKGMLDTERSVSKLQASVRLGTGGFLSYGRAISSARSATSGVNKSITDDQAIAGMTKLFGSSGSVDFAEQTIRDVATTSVATGEPVERLAGLVGELGKSFKIKPGEEMQDSLESFFELVNKGGIEVDEAMNYMSQFGASAKAAGLEGSTGLRSMFGFVNTISGGLGSGRQAMMATRQITQGLDAGTYDKAATSVLGLDLKGMRDRGDSFEHMLGAMVEKSGGDPEKLRKVVGSGPAYQAMVELSKLGKTSREVSDALRTAGKTAMSFDQGLGKLAKDAADRPAQRFDAAINQIRQTLTESPEAASLMQKVAETASNKAPVVAKGLGSVLDVANSDWGITKLLAGGAAVKYGLPAVASKAAPLAESPIAAMLAGAAITFGATGLGLQSMQERDYAQNDYQRVGNIGEFLGLLGNAQQMSPLMALAGGLGSLGKTKGLADRKSAQQTREKYGFATEEDETMGVLLGGSQAAFAWEEYSIDSLEKKKATGERGHRVGAGFTAEEIKSGMGVEFEDPAARFLRESMTTTTKPAEAAAQQEQRRVLLTKIAEGSSIRITNEVINVRIMGPGGGTAGGGYDAGGG